MQLIAALEHVFCQEK